MPVDAEVRVVSPSAEAPAAGAPAWTQAVAEVAASLEVDVGAGLSAAEAARRRARHGPNRIAEYRRRPAWAILLSQFQSLIVGLLVVAGGVAFAFGDLLEAGAIAAVIVINAALGFGTELRAVRSMEALRRLGRVRAHVRRDGQVQDVPADDLVPGDVLVLGGGDVVPADVRLAESSRLQADESALTGESVPVDKDAAPVGAGAPLAERTCMLYRGTALTRGTAEGVVVATGMETELGRISRLAAQAAPEETPLEKRLDRLGRRLLGLTLVVAAAVVLSGLASGKSLLLMIETGIALAVATIPEGLPIVATMALARGMWLMARRNALVRRLSSVETLGVTDVICTDKTGTLTENRMTVVRYLLASGDVVAVPEGEAAAFLREGEPVDAAEHAELRAALEVGVLCNDAALAHAPSGQPRGDPMEVALLRAGRRAGLAQEALVRRYPRQGEEAFDPAVKMMATVHEGEDGAFVAVKGAPEVVLEAATRVLTAEGVAPLDAAARAAWMARNERLAAEGMRLLGLARKRRAEPGTAPYTDLTLVGLVGLMDPPRADVPEAIAQCRSAGIRVVMVTGDQPATALGVARKIGLVEGTEDPPLPGAALRPVAELTGAEHRRLLATPIFARVAPEEKLYLIELYQRHQHVVAMTGDGVNDAPALRKADIGIAMGLRGTEVAREAAYMVLQDDAFSTIVAAVKQGRIIYDNIRRFIFYLLSCNLSEVLVVGLASLVGAALPLLPLQILFLNLVTDVFPALALGMGRGSERVMQRPPRPADDPILTRRHWRAIGAYGLLITAVVLTAFVLAQRVLHLPVAEAVTVSFLTLAFAQLWHVFNMRDHDEPAGPSDIVRNPYVWGALGLCTLLLLGAVYVPPLALVLETHVPNLAAWALILGMSLVPLLPGLLPQRRGRAA